VSILVGARIRDALRAASIPFVRVSIIDAAAHTVRVDYDDTATAQQRVSGGAIVSAFDWSSAADASYVSGRIPDLKAVRDQAAAAVSANTTYLAIATPTAAQVAAEVKALTQQMNAVIKAISVLAIQEIGNG
jgi:hypothetical protein